MLSKNAFYFPMIEEICGHYGLPLGCLCSKRRARGEVDAKSTVVRFFRLCGYSYPRIGAILEKDHSTIMHADRRADKFPQIAELATTVYYKYNKQEKQRLDDFDVAAARNVQILREKVLYYFNRGFNKKEIAKICGASLEEITDAINFLTRTYTPKKVPDYKNNTSRTILVAPTFLKNYKKIC